MDTVKKISNKRKQIPKKLYHGTTSRHVKSLRRGADVTMGNKRTDFGQSFYLTSKFNQAKDHAKRRVFNKEYPIVFVYKLDYSQLLRSYRGKILNDLDLEWARIYNNRSQKANFKHNYDYVFGGVADGKIFDLVNAVDFGRLTMKNFLDEIAKYKSYNQLSIHNQDIIKFNILKLKRKVSVNG